MLRRGGRMMPSLRRMLVILPLWIACTVWMWNWWLTADFTRYRPLFIPLTLAMLYEFAVLPSVFAYFVVKAKKPARRVAAKKHKVAVISLCVPSVESLDIVENQLKAMSQITYPHDSWILDEGNSPEIKRLARKYGVKHFSRKGIPAYNRLKPPFQKKTKAGNVNAWLSHVKKRKYDFFVQLDIDHIPKPNYLYKTLGYFKDPRVAWVQAPSVYKNLNEWTSRGAAEQELVLQGPLQMGFYGHSETPFIIGSHCTYRMSAIAEIGGFQPTRAEDHLDTVHLAHNGYKGVFLPEIIAEGDGPDTLSIYLAQQYAWAYSMFQVLLKHSPGLLKSMSLKRKLQFLFAQTWYPLWSFTYLVMFMSPIMALIANQNIANVQAEAMLVHFMPVFVCSFLIWWAARPLMQPRNLHLSWRGVILHAVRWPILLRAIFDAFFKVKKPYMITPKGSFAHNVPSLRTYQPFLTLGLLSVGTVLVTSLLRQGNIPQAQVIYALINALFMLSICIVDLSIRFKQTRVKLSEVFFHWFKPIAATAALSTLVITAGLVSSLSIGLAQERPIITADSIASTTAITPVHAGMSTKELTRQISLVAPRTGSTPRLGVYNPDFLTTASNKPHIQHTFVDWRDEHYLALALGATEQAGNTPLITIEPRGDKNGNRLLSDIATGRYDERLDKISAILAASKNPVYVRFAHEMELAQLYPWGSQDAALYKKAYQRVVARLGSHNSQVKFVWSPAGNHGAEVYYPGDNYVDVIGTTVLYDKYWYGSRVPEFRELAEGRRWLSQYNKPVWIVEFGVGKSNARIQQRMIAQAVAQHQDLGFSKLMYINIKDANINGPDYRLGSQNDFTQLIKTSQN